MNFRNIVYVSALTGFLDASNGCAAALPDLKNPEVRAQFEGVYQGVVVDGKGASYKVNYKISKEGCVALVDFGKNELSHIIDKDCDNTAEFMNLQNREYLLKTDKAQDVDEVLEYIQRNLVKPEYKVE